MKSFRPSARRIVSIAAAGVVGLAATLFIASPASAHHTNISGQVSCNSEKGEWVISWTINSWITTGSPSQFQLVTVSSNAGGTLSTGLDAPSALQSIATPFTGTQTLPGSTSGNVTLTVKAKWSNNLSSTRTGPITGQSGQTVPLTLPEGGCAPDPDVTFASDCNKLTATLHNENGTSQASFTVPGQSSPVVVAAGGTGGPFDFPKGSTGITITSGQDEWTGDWKDPGECPTDPPPTTDPPRTTEPPTTEPPLAQTGTSLGGVIGTGAGLLALGAILMGVFLFLRRRRNLGETA